MIAEFSGGSFRFTPEFDEERHAMLEIMVASKQWNKARCSLLGRLRECGNVPKDAVGQPTQGHPAESSSKSSGGDSSPPDGPDCKRKIPDTQAHLQQGIFSLLAEAIASGSRAWKSVSSI